MIEKVYEHLGYEYEVYCKEGDKLCNVFIDEGIVRDAFHTQIINFEISNYDGSDAILKAAIEKAERYIEEKFGN